MSTSDGSGVYSYDAFGRRVSRSVAGVSTSYLHDRANPVLVNDEFLLAGLRVDEIFASITASGTTSYLTDALGSTVALTDESGASIASFAYEPYGKATRTGTGDTHFRFTGREDDGASSLHYFRARYYSPQFGRFISSDPLGLAGGVNTYAYARGNPLLFIDPFGLQEKDPNSNPNINPRYG